MNQPLFQTDSPRTFLSKTPESIPENPLPEFHQPSEENLEIFLKLANDPLYKEDLEHLTQRLSSLKSQRDHYKGFLDQIVSRCEQKENPSPNFDNSFQIFKNSSHHSKNSSQNQQENSENHFQNHLENPKQNQVENFSINHQGNSGNSSQKIDKIEENYEEFVNEYIKEKDSKLDHEYGRELSNYIDKLNLRIDFLRVNFLDETSLLQPFENSKDPSQFFIESQNFSRKDIENSKKNFHKVAIFSSNNINSTKKKHQKWISLDFCIKQPLDSMLDVSRKSICELQMKLSYFPERIKQLEEENFRLGNVIKSFKKGDIVKKLNRKFEENNVKKKLEIEEIMQSLIEKQKEIHEKMKELEKRELEIEVKEEKLMKAQVHHYDMRSLKPSMEESEKKEIKRIEEEAHDMKIGAVCNNCRIF